ncbi:MAG: tautomerase family protein [Acidobacteriota bacterium]
MPLVQVSVVGEKTPSEKAAIMNAVQSALVQAFGIPEHDRNIRLRSYSPDDWMLPPGKTDRYVLVEIAAFAGRTPETKGRLFSQVVANLGALGIEPGDVFVIVMDQPLHNWGIRGGQRADLVDLGFDVKV